MSYEPGEDPLFFVCGVVGTLVIIVCLLLGAIELVSMIIEGMTCNAVG